MDFKDIIVAALVVYIVKSIIQGDPVFGRSRFTNMWLHQTVDTLYFLAVPTVCLFVGMIVFEAFCAAVMPHYQSSPSK